MSNSLILSYWWLTRIPNVWFNCLLIASRNFEQCVNHDCDFNKADVFSRLGQFQENITFNQNKCNIELQWNNTKFSFFDLNLYMFIEITKPAFLNCIPSNGCNFTNNHQIDSILVLLESDVLLIFDEKFATLVKKH